MEGTAVGVAWVCGMLKLNGRKGPGCRDTEEASIPYLQLPVRSLGSTCTVI